MSENTLPRTKLKVGDRVRYHSSLPIRATGHYLDTTVTDVYPDGIPSCREPMVKVEGAAGVRLASHCVPLCACMAPRDMGYLDTMMDGMCGNCERPIGRRAA